MSPPITSFCNRHNKKQELKPGAGSKDFTKAGLFHCKEGTPISDLFPTDLSKKYYLFFCFHNRKCSMPCQSCEFNHVGWWDRVSPEDQRKILKHCHASKGKKVGLMQISLPSATSPFLRSLSISLEMHMALKVRRCFPWQQ